MLFHFFKFKWVFERGEWGYKIERKNMQKLKHQIIPVEDIYKKENCKNEAPYMSQGWLYSTIYEMYVHFYEQKQKHERSVVSGNEEDWLNDAQAPLATVFRDPNQTNHCSCEKKQVNSIENEEAPWAGLWSDIAQDNKQRQTRTVSDVKDREISCFSHIHRSGNSAFGNWEWFLLSQCLPYWNGVLL